MKTKIVTYRYLAKHPYHIAAVEDGFKPHPAQHIGCFRHSYRFYEVPVDFDTRTGLTVLTAMYLKGLSSNTNGSIRIASNDKFKKQL